MVDVGGGLGANLSLILSRLPQLKGVNFDLPPVVSEAPKIHGNYFSIPENIAMNIVFTQCHKCLSQYSGKSMTELIFILRKSLLQIYRKGL